MKNFLIHTKSESGDHYYYFVSAKVKPRRSVALKYLQTHGNDIEDGHLFENIQTITEITEFKLIK
jgi:hypothetical protein